MNNQVPIRIFDSDLNLIGEVDDYLYTSFTRNWNSSGEFTLTINEYSNGASLLQKGHIIIIGNEPTLSGIIKHREIVLSEAGRASEAWTIQGLSLGGITKQRITDPPNDDYISISGHVETIMRGLVDACFISTSAARQVSNLQLESDQSRGDLISRRSRYKNLHDELEELSVLSGLGWEIVPEVSSGVLRFKVLQGLDRTFGQEVNPPVVLSPDYDSITTQHFRDSDLGYCNCIYVGGQGEGDARAIEVVTSGATGLDRSEYFQDARNTPTEDLTTQGEQTLRELDTETIFEATINRVGPFTYRQDWDLGDLITVQNKRWGQTVNAQIVSVTETYSASGQEVSVVLGNQFPNLASQLKKRFSNIDNEVRR